MNILMLGVPGAGKGTQARLLSETLGIPHVSSGDVFRNLDKSSTVWEKARPYVEGGGLVPDPIVMELMKERLEKDDLKNGVILDGFPRTLPQAEQLDTFFKIDRVLFITISEEEFIRRLGGRLSCPRCGRTYSDKEAKPEQEGMCDNCNIALVKRKDESDEALKERIRVYHKDTEPLITFYKNKGILVEIEGERPIQPISEDIKNKLGI